MTVKTLIVFVLLTEVLLIGVLDNYAWTNNSGTTTYYVHTFTSTAAGKHIAKHFCIRDQVCKNRSYLHIQFYDFEDT